MGLTRLRLTAALALIFVVAAALVVVACDSGPTTRSVVARGPARVVLRDGFRVASNSRLVGGVFDRPDRQEWSAVLEIERDPVGVYDDYAAQARGLGVPLPGSGASQRVCVPVGSTPSTTSQKCNVFGPACYVASAQLACHGVAGGGPKHPLGVEFKLAWGRDTRHALLTVTHTTAEDADPPGHFSAEKLTTPLPPLVVRPAHRGDRPGTRFGAENNAFRRGYRRFVLESGSRLLADAPALGLAILQIDEGAEMVLGRYVAQLASPGAAPAVAHTPIPGGGAILESGFSPEGGGGATLTTDRTQRYVVIVYASD
jgi:hypothetical protein